MSFLKRSLTNLIGNQFTSQITNQTRAISTSQAVRSDALFVHRENDADVKNFKFNDENIKVSVQSTR